MNPARLCLFWLASCLGLLLPVQGHGLTIADSPLFLSGSVQPLVMLDFSKDQQLYKKAYNDYSDLDGDGEVETGYKHSISYYGYFDPGKCYTYSTANQRFEPASVSATKYCSGQWSGNFLNWASMTRMDAVRKLLYGGLRSIDSATDTVLERAYLPTDAHSFAKYYNGNDIAQLTPFNPPITPASVTATSSSVNLSSLSLPAAITLTVSTTTAFSYGDQVKIIDSANPANYMVGSVGCVNGTGISAYNGLVSVSSCSAGQIKVAAEKKAGSGSITSWRVENWTQTGLTLCNTTLGASSGANALSQTNTSPPLLRVAQGNFALWAANERWQCLWRDETSSPAESTGSLSGATRVNGNRAAITGLYASTIGPNKTASSAGRIANALGSGDFNVRVQACVSGLIGNEKCNRYPDGDYKPVGLLQVYGDTNQILFGLMTGSYAKNISGGVVRKNVSAFNNEVNTLSNGTFTATVGIVKALDKLRIYGYCYGGCSNNGAYNDAAADNCPWQLTDITEGRCTTWGNPMAELYYESLRYFTSTAATTPTSAYNYTSAGSKDTALGLPLPAWSPPITSANYCAPINNLVFNASVSTNDFDLASTTVLSSGQSAATLANQVGTGEGIAGGSYFIGANGTDNNQLCSAKTVPNLGSIYGICPEGPTLLGSYLMPGEAYWSHHNRIRSDLTVPVGDTKSLKVATYGVQLATNVPTLSIKLTGETSPRAVLQPIYRLALSSTSVGGGSLVDMKIISQTASSTVASGTIYLNWEDSEQGGDYDQDEWGILTYCLTTVAGGCGVGSSANTLTVSTTAVAYSTANPQGFGYVTSGTTRDGPHFHSGILNFNYTDPTGVTGCSNCNSGPTTSYTYTLGGSAAHSLQDPMYYAAKWGGFSDLNGDGIPNNSPTPATEWDTIMADGTPGSDGVPDNYFFVNNPQGLEKALNAAFLKILRDASASGLATNSTALNNGSRIYQGRFSSATWTGQLLSYRLNSDGSVASSASLPPGWDPAVTPWPEWDAAQALNAQVGTSSDTRLIITKGGSGQGTDFQYANLTTGASSQQYALNRDMLLNLDNCGPERVAYLRGRSANEGVGSFTCASGTTVQKFRARDISKLGDIVSSSAAFVGAPQAGYSELDHPGYADFKASFQNRKPVVYVGANDGMVHGFDATVDAATNLPGANAGQEVLAYVPSPVYNNLSRLTDNNYKSTHKYYVDGSPMQADACFSNCTDAESALWKTLLVGGLGAGGRGFYALNVTNPGSDDLNSVDTPKFTLANAANLLLWEFTPSDDADLGYTYNSSPVRISTGQAKQVVKFENGRWGVVLGNGYNSPAGKAVLYVLFVNGPTGIGGAWQAGGLDYVKIVADAPVAADNGLSTPAPYDADGNGLADTVYAGDIKGNVWKFDLSNVSPASWGLAYKLFAAGTSQPITTSLDVSPYSASGAMVLFGTGKYLESADSTSTTAQAFYGIYDSGAPVSGTGQLAQQTITTTTSGGITYRTVAAACGASPLPACPTPFKGWYADLPASGERVTGSPTLISGTIFFNTFIPSVTPCDFGGTGWLMGLDYGSGAMRPFTVFDTNVDGNIDSSDVVAGGVKVGAALGGTTIIKGGSPPLGGGSSSGSGSSGSGSGSSGSGSGSSGSGSGSSGSGSGSSGSSGSSSSSGGNASTGSTGVGVSSLTTGDTSDIRLNFGAASKGRFSWRELLQ